MIFKASPQLLDLIADIDDEILRNRFLLIAYSIGGSIYLYMRNGEIIDWVFIIGCSVMVLLLCWINYLRNSSAASTINITAIKVIILDDKLIVNTPSIKSLFGLTRPALELQFDIRKFSRHQVSYPFKPIYDLDKKIWRLNAVEKEVYIITDYFDIEFKEELESFLYWTDTSGTV